MSRSIRGFSLLELLVVLVIVGIVAVVSGTWYGAAQPVAVKGTVNTLHGVLLEARTVAQTTGRTIPLTASGNQATGGAQPTLMLRFPSQGDFVTWRAQGAGSATTKYSGIDTDGAWPIYAQAAPNPDPLVGGVPAIAALFTNGVPPGTAGKLFTGAINTAMSFDATGRPNRDFYVYVGGMRNGASYRSAPVGLVLVTRTGIHSFYKPNAGDPNVPWQRL